MSLKKTRRKGFNFFRSYFDLYNELNDKDKLQFIDALLNKQFLGVEPQNLTGLSRFAYLSQKHSIDKQVKGYEDKTGLQLSDNKVIDNPTDDPTEGGTVDPTDDPTLQGEGQVQGEEKEEDINTYRSFDHLSLSQEEFSRLESRWTEKQIEQVLDAIENYDKNKNYKSLYLTAKNWLVKDYPEKVVKLPPIMHWNLDEE